MARLHRRGCASQRGRMLQLLTDRGHYGATDEELCELMDLYSHSVNPRRWQLVKDGLVTDSGRLRPTTNNMDAIVWVLAKFAHAPMEEQCV